MKAMKKNDDDKYKEDNFQHQDSNEIFINTNKEVEALVKRLMSRNFKHHVIQCVIDIVNSCGGKMI